MVGNGDAVGVASQILQHPARPAKRRFDVNHPIDGEGLLAESFKGGGFGQRLRFPVEAERALAEGLSQRAQKRFSEAMAEYTYRQEEGGFWTADPA